MSGLTVGEQLRRERRSCPVCALEVESPLVERCPRCFALLPKLAVHCEGCVHRLVGPARAAVGDSSQTPAANDRLPATR